MADTSMALVPTGAAYLPSEQEAAHTYKLSTNAAGLCGEIVKATAMKIQGRRYVKSEGWLAIAMAHGCVVSVRDVEQVEGGIRAIAELRRMSDQALIATAEGFVGDDEKMWAGRPMFARRAMAQTRAGSRVCRTVFAHVAIMVDAGLATTPAEEMQGVYDYEGDPRGDAPPQEHTWTTEAKADGLMNGTPPANGAKRKAMEEWTDKALNTLRLTGMTVAELDAQWNGWANDIRPPAKMPKLEGLQEYAPDLYAKVERVFNEVRDAARARAA